MTGVAFMLSAGGVFLRDLRDVVTVFSSVNLFAQPILYNPFNVPPWMDWVFLANPFSYLIWCWQDALFHGQIMHPIAWVVLPIASVATLGVGWMIFERTRHAFGDAL
jgi:lipopolysaccharide transport system permease protein